MAFEADLPGVDGFIGFKIVEGAAGSPSPRAQGAPIIELAGLAFVDEADDAFGEAGAVVRLNAGGDDGSVAPAFGEKLLLPGGTFVGEGRQLRCGEALADGGHGFGAPAQLHDDGDRTGGVGGSSQRQLDVNVDG